MKKIVILSLLLTCLITAISQTPLDIVNKHIEAIGGKKKIFEMKSLKLEFKTDNEIAGSGSITLVLEAGLRQEVKTLFGIMTTIVNKKKGWEVYRMTEEDKPEVTPMSETDRSISFPTISLDIEEHLQNDELIKYARYGETKYNKAVLEGKEKVEGTECYKLKVSIDGKLSTWYIDTETYYCVKKIGKGDDGENNEFVYGDFKKNADGCTFAFTKKMYSKGKLLMTMTYTTIETNFKVDKSLFVYKEN